MFQNFAKMKTEHQLLFILGCLIIIIAIFWPRQGPVLTAGVSAHLGNLGGKIQLEAFDNDDESFHNYSGKTMALFYAPWCPHCKNMMPEWDKFKQSYMQKGGNVKIVSVDCDKYSDMGKKFGVQSFPTIYFLPKGLNDPSARVEYKGDRSGEAFLAFVANK